MKRNEQPQEARQRPDEAINNDNIVNIVNKCFDDVPSTLPGCYQDYSGGVLCLVCELRLHCARQSAGGQE